MLRVNALLYMRTVREGRISCVLKWATQHRRAPYYGGMGDNSARKMRAHVDKARPCRFSDARVSRRVLGVTKLYWKGREGMKKSPCIHCLQTETIENHFVYIVYEDNRHRLYFHHKVHL